LVKVAYSLAIPKVAKVAIDFLAVEEAIPYSPCNYSLAWLFG